MLLRKLKCKCETLGVPATENLLLVSVPEQKLWHFRGENFRAEYKISTSRAAPSCVENSLGTPDGLFAVCEKIGAGVPAGTDFKGRKSTGLHFSEFLKNAPDENLITTRILRLDGLEVGKNKGGNVDTFSRFVYIHGTNQENRLGTPNSHGCILLGNAEILELFDALPSKVAAGTPFALLFVDLGE